MSDRCEWRSRTEGGAVLRCQLPTGHDTKHPTLPGAWHVHERGRGITAWPENSPNAYDPTQPDLDATAQDGQAGEHP